MGERVSWTLLHTNTVLERRNLLLAETRAEKSTRACFNEVALIAPTGGRVIALTADWLRLGSLNVLRLRGRKNGRNLFLSEALSKECTLLRMPPEHSCFSGSMGIDTGVAITLFSGLDLHFDFS